MAEHVLSHHPMAHGVERRHARVPIVRLVLDRFLLLPIGAAIAILWANVDGASYFTVAHALAFPVNEIGMALFLALITQEVIEAVMPGGALHTWRGWGLPIAAAIGGVIGAAVVFLGYVYVQHEEVLAVAWPIACAIDIAAGYYVLKLLVPRSAAIPFLLVLAIATDVVALIVLAAWEPFTEVHIAGAVLLVAAMATAALFRALRVRSFWGYLFGPGVIAWIACFLADVHPALALVPIVPFLPHEPRQGDLFADPKDDDAVHHVEHEWHEAVQVVLFLFGLVNAGVLLRGYDTGTWAVLAAALVGRPLGILLGVFLARAAGLPWPRRIGWRELAVVACATSSGFTLSLFFASGLLPVGAVLQQIKFGALLTAAGALIAMAVAKLLRIGRFAT